MPESSERGALTEAVYYILLSLTTPLHGYGIMQFVSEISHGRVNLGAGTLYGAINTLLDKGWICAAHAPESQSSKKSAADKRAKKEYIITEQGKEILLHEIDRLKELVETGEQILHQEESNND